MTLFRQACHYCKQRSRRRAVTTKNPKKVHRDAPFPGGILQALDWLPTHPAYQRPQEFGLAPTHRHTGSRKRSLGFRLKLHGHNSVRAGASSQSCSPNTQERLPENENFLTERPMARLHTNLQSEATIDPKILSAKSIHRRCGYEALDNQEDCAWTETQGQEAGKRFSFFVGPAAGC